MKYLIYLLILIVTSGCGKEEQTASDLKSSEEVEELLAHLSSLDLNVGHRTLLIVNNRPVGRVLSFDIVTDLANQKDANDVILDETEFLVRVGMISDKKDFYKKTELKIVTLEKVEIPLILAHRDVHKTYEDSVENVDGSLHYKLKFGGLRNFSSIVIESKGKRDLLISQFECARIVSVIEEQLKKAKTKNKKFRGGASMQIRF